MPYHGRDDYSGESVFIPEGWQPSGENINALPLPLRAFIHELKTLCAAADLVQEVACLREEAFCLRRAIAELKGSGRDGTRDVDTAEPPVKSG